ncbi:Diphthamide biosynthesis protein 2 [Didymella heteroderae]|uniref:2-(3-amino-3-carboxypropyl)histidine synthase subunit 2 n=1 Tax=Didymella heteroderae TaxID=1769908 RepID=A0A9P4WP85_9PLEO|nr:Diphthamide biosynthesis protein 2 [Didymella heteroderae]
MAVPALAQAPVLSTPDTHIFEDPTPAVDASSPRLSDEQVAITYEIERTVKEIRDGRWNRIALQFPDHMLVDAPRVYEQLSRGLAKAKKAQTGSAGAAENQQQNGKATVEELGKQLETNMGLEEKTDEADRLFILGDTSYGACCVDEVAAEHVDADCVVHYGRSCLSPPSRLPVIYVFTERPLDLDQTVSTFQSTYPDTSQKVILMADIPYAHHIPALHTRLEAMGYTSLFSTSIVHDPASPLPNRTTPPGTADDKTALLDWALFHISSPPDALLLTLSSRVASTHIYPTAPSPVAPTAEVANTRMTLRRRYALCTSLSTTPVFGILINTLSVKNYMSILSHVQKTIAAAGKKSYTFVVGKVNAAKVANFSEVGGWVVIGCWESSLIESKDFWRPLITPFELEIALQEDTERVWTGEWSGDFTALLDDAAAREKEKEVQKEKETETAGGAIRTSEEAGDGDAEYDSEEESAPPEFDLRTGRYVSHSRPMAAHSSSSSSKPVQQASGDETAGPMPASDALTKRANGALASVNGVVSPGAEFLRSKRTWVGLGSDYNDPEHAGEHAAKMEEGRSGIARGYHVGEDAQKS